MIYSVIDEFLVKRSKSSGKPSSAASSMEVKRSIDLYPINSRTNESKSPTTVVMDFTSPDYIRTVGIENERLISVSIESNVNYECALSSNKKAEKSNADLKFICLEAEGFCNPLSFGVFSSG
uniref:Uncharacterized protein n=1 Tax=Romanomermis culicivorax TaxID=13658 RepID=A0A915KNG0_ROMCU